MNLDNVCAGSIRPLASGKRSAIAKVPLAGPVPVNMDGIEGDRQADRRHHGFPAMAVHHLPCEHLRWLVARFGLPHDFERPGSLGENFSTTGLLEGNVRIGDRFRAGTALLEVSQPRQPCATIEHHLQCKGVVKAMVAEAKSGWFYRVIEPGIVSAGDILQPVERMTHRWTVSRAFQLVYGRESADLDRLAELAALDRVSDRLVRDIEKRTRPVRPS